MFDQSLTLTRQSKPRRRPQDRRGTRHYGGWPRAIVAAPALRVEPGGGLPTLSQYLLDPPYAYGVFGSEFLEHLLGVFTQTCKK